MMVGVSTGDWFSRKKPKRTPPAEPKSRRTYSPEEVIEQFKYRLGGLDNVFFINVGPPRDKLTMTAHLGIYTRCFELTKRPYESLEIAEACALIFEGLRHSMEHRRKIA